VGRTPEAGDNNTRAGVYLVDPQSRVYVKEAVVLPLGDLGGKGKVDGVTRQEGGRIVPGNVDQNPQAGRLTIEGMYVANSGSLNIDLGGLTPDSQHDVLHVVGPASLGGTLEVSYLGGFVAQIGNQFSVLTIPETSGSLNGAFDLLDVTQAPLPYGGAWDVEYDRYDSDQDGLLEVILKVVPTDIAITGFRADGQDMLVDYTISQGSVAGFDIGIYRSANGSLLDAPLMSQRIIDPLLLSQGSHTATVAADFADPQIDYYLAAVVDAAQEVIETNETNNTAFFSGGAFRDETREVVHAHGTDLVADAVDVVLSGNQLEVWLHGQPFSYPEADVSQVHIRTHDGADSITASVSKPIWGFGGDDDDQLRGGCGNDYLRGGSGNDTYRFAGSADLGSDTIAEWLQGPPEGGTDTLDFSELSYAVSVNLANTGSQTVAPNLRLTLTDDDGIENVVSTPFGDVLRGNARNNWLYCGDGNDTAYGAYGNDAIYGYGGIDHLFGELGTDYLNGGAGDDELYGGYGLDFLSGADGDDYLNVVDDYGGDYAYGDSGDDTAYGDPNGYGGSSDYLFVEHPYPPGEGGGDSALGGDDAARLEALNTWSEELLSLGLDDPRTLELWRALLWFYTEPQKKRDA
jgi:Ca2+-binding RTX toxin-like protein